MLCRHVERILIYFLATCTSSAWFVSCAAMGMGPISKYADLYFSTFLCLYLPTSGVLECRVPDGGPQLPDPRPGHAAEPGEV